MSERNEASGQADAAAGDMRSVVVERELPHPPDKVWRALTQPHLIGEWLAKTDFEPETGHRFTVRIEPQPGRSFVFDCEVVAVEPHRLLTYAWNSVGDEAGKGLRSTVTWRLSATANGTRLHMEQTGFKPDQPNYYHGARMGWPGMIAKLEETLAALDRPS